MLKTRDRNILERIITYCEQIKGAIAMFDDTLETLRANYVYRNSVSMCTLQIGELTKHLTTEFKNAYSLIPWKEIIKMRNIAAHHYDKFDMETLHDVITNDVPQLCRYCQGILDGNA